MGERAGQLGVPGALPKGGRWVAEPWGAARRGGLWQRGRAGGAVRVHVRGSARGEWSPSGGRGGQGRGRGGARTPSSTGFPEAAARPPAGGRQPPYPEPENLGLRGR